MRFAKVVVILSCGLLWIAANCPLRAQSTQGTILGTVMDPSRAVIPKAEVTLTNVKTGVVATTETNASGDYQFFDLIEGTYSVRVVAAGFRDEVLHDLLLVARQKLRVDATLRVGNMSQTVAVNAQGIGAISTESASIKSTYSSVDVENLPANYRASQNGTSPLSLIQTLPGVQADTASATGTGARYSVQGGLPSQSDITVDGITAQNATSNEPLANALPSGEAISEMTVEGSLAAPEFGQPGQITIISKSGTNQLHGGTFWYFQNSAMNAIPYGAVTKPHIVGNDFGGFLSGPIVIPHLYNGHNRSFFFGEFEGFRLPNSTPEQYSVPTASMQQGDFSQVVGVKPLADPFTGGTYANDTVPINSVSQNFLQFFPTPNAGNANGYTPGEINYLVNKNSAYNSNQFTVRGDQYFGRKAMAFVRYTWKNVSQNEPEPLLVPEGASIDQDRVLIAALNYTFTPHLLNEARFGFTLDTSGSSNSFNGPAFAKQTGLEGLQNLFFNGIPELDFVYLTSENADRITETTKSRVYEYTDELTWTKGNHVVTAGFDIRHMEAITPLSFFGADNYGTFGFNGTAPTSTGQEFADFLIGVPYATAYDVVQADNDGLSNHYAYFAQDQWTVMQRLTLIYGLRYEYEPGYYDPSGDIGNFNPAVPLSGEAIYPDGAQNNLATGFLASFDACTVGTTSGSAENGAPCTPVLDNSQAGLPNSLKTVPHLRLMPRFGFAYRPFNDARTAIRGGFAMYNITSLGSSFYSLTGTLQSATTEYTNSQSATGPAYAWPQIYAGEGTSSAAGAYGTAYFGTANAVHWKDPYSEQFALSLDHEFGNGYGARISYIGMETHDLIWAPNLNDLPSMSTTTSAYFQPLSARPFPNWGVVNTRADGADANYNSLQIDVHHHTGNGLTFDSSYTWAKNLSDDQGQDNTGFAGEVGGSRGTYYYDPRVDFGNVYGTRRNLWNTTLVYELPFGRGRKFGAGISRIEDTLLGGWQVSSMFLWQSGPFLSPYFPGGNNMDPSGTGSGLSSNYQGGSYPGRNQPPDRVAQGRAAHPTAADWINRAAYVCPGQEGSWVFGQTCDVGGVTTNSQGQTVSIPPIGRFGDAQVGSLVGPGTVNLSGGLFKIFAITQRVNLRLEGTFTNLPNHANLGDPILNVTNPEFGEITTARGSGFGSARNGQVSARIEF